MNGRIHDRLRKWLADAAGELLSKLRQEKGSRDKQTLSCMDTVANLLMNQGAGEAEPLFVEALRGMRETLGDTHPDTLNSINSLYRMLHDVPGRAGEVMLLRLARSMEERKIHLTRWRALSMLLARRGRRQR